MEMSQYKKCIRLVIGGGIQKTPYLCLHDGSQIAGCPEDCPFYVAGSPIKAEELLIPEHLKRLKRLRILSIILIFLIIMCTVTFGVLLTESIFIFLNLL